LWRSLREWRWIPLTMFALSLLSIVILSWSKKIMERERMDFAIADALMDMQTKVAVFHLWFEEVLEGDIDVPFEAVWKELDEALKLVAVLLQGGESEHGFKMEPLKSPRELAYVEEIRSLLKELRNTALEREKTPKTTGIGTPMDQSFDEIFKRFMDKTLALGEIVERDRMRGQSRGRQVYSGILFLWCFVVGTATLGVWNRETRRKAAELALQRANEQLRSQTEELMKHREHLMELVEERTADLTGANRELQQEIIERRLVARALEESRNTFEKLSLEFNALLDAIPDALFLLSPELEILWSNKSAVSILEGETQQEPAGRPCRQLGGNRLNCHGECPVLRAFKTGKAEGTRVSASDGTTLDIRAFPITDENGQVINVIEIAADITEKVTLHAEALRIAHLASLGELAAGVAHEINNPINSIINYAQIVMDEWSGPEEDSDIPARIIEEGERIATIVASLLSFAHEKRAEKLPIHVRDLLSETLCLAGKQLEKDGIILELSVPDGLPAISANFQHMQQVLLNLMSNARYALNQKYPVPHKEKILEILAEETAFEGSHSMKITFRDHGVGIPAAIVDKITEPFFSTKPKGMGTGLGLSISHGIVSDHGGRLLFHSRETEYTEVQILLPLGVRQ